MISNIAMAGLETTSQVGQGSGLLSFIGTSLFPGIESAVVYNGQGGWKKHPVILPPVSALMSAELKGYFWQGIGGRKPIADMNDLVWAMRRQGVKYGKEDLDSTDGINWDYYGRLWDTIYDSQIERPGIAEVFRLRIAGLLDDEAFERMLRRNAALKDDWDCLYPFFCNRPSIDQVLALWRRGSVDDKELEYELKYRQVGISDDRTDLKELTSEIPGYQDIIRFAIREAFNPQQITALELDKELDQNTDFLDWAYAAGLGKTTITNQQGKEISVDFAKLYWYAHWELPSPGQCYDFFHKYYAKSRYGPSPYLQYAKKFDDGDLRNLLKANDYSPAFRDHLAGAAYLPYTRIDVRRIRKEGLITKEQVYHNYRASGYDDEHANSLTEYIEKDISNSKNAPVKSGTKTQLCKAFALGSIKLEDVKEGLKAIGFTQNEADGQAGLCEMQTSNSILTSAVNSIRGGFLLGAFTVDETVRALREYQVIQDKIDQYLSLWTLQLDARRKQISASIVSRWYVDGIIGEEELTSRLFKLNFSELNVSRIIIAAKWEAAKRVAKANKVAAGEAQKQIERNLREAEKQRKQADALARQRKRELDQQQSALLKAEKDRITRFLAGRTEANLRTWLANKEITEDEIRYTFTVKGWNPGDIERWLEAERRKG